MAGFKVFADLEVLTAEDVNDYLMGQVIPRFDDEAERDAAIAVPPEGMLCYVTGIGLQIGAGGDWANFGEDFGGLPTGGTTGQVLAKASDDDHDTEWVDVASGDVVAATVRQTVAQSIPNTTWTALNFDTEDEDTPAGHHATSGTTSRFTAQVDGWYVASGTAAFAGNATGRRGARWALNGSAVHAGATLVYAGGAAAITVPAKTYRVHLAATDYLTLEVYQESGGALNTSVANNSDQSGMQVWLLQEG